MFFDILAIEKRETENKKKGNKSTFCLGKKYFSIYGDTTKISIFAR